MTANADATPVRITALRHNDDVPLCRFAGWLEEAGAQVDLIALDEGAPVPDVADLGDGLLVLGGIMDALADEANPFLPAERALVARAVEQDVPLLGICLGHQILAVALGGQMEVSSALGPESGPVHLNLLPGAAQDPVLGPAVQAAGGEVIVYQSHHDTVTVLPEEATLLATSRAETGEHLQAFRVGSALGVQFHPEADLDLIGRWFAMDRTVDDATRERLLTEAGAVDAQVAATGRALARAFVAQVRASAGA